MCCKRDKNVIYEDIQRRRRIKRISKKTALVGTDCFCPCYVLHVCLPSSNLDNPPIAQHVVLVWKTSNPLISCKLCSHPVCHVRTACVYYYTTTVTWEK